ncbi:MAG: CusA/CzcA family heavy metal efflux RND transporter, partial [Bacteroidales bacterium]|nr:CusA/CzcA family heavy metal efflux RND transporter [Bacteroidales bacterium]
IAMMLKGANANVVTGQLEQRVAKVQKMLPEGIVIEPYLNRSELVGRNISTVVRNLIEGALIVFLVLMVFLGDVRAGLLVASVIPLAMLFGFILMRLAGVSANLMSLGAIDFGIVVDGSIVIVEGILAHLYGQQLAGRRLTAQEMGREVERGATQVVGSATFAVLIILVVFFPLLTLTGIEGKYFTPMAKTLVFCIVGALLLSLTYVPMMAALTLRRTAAHRPTLADRFFGYLERTYRRTLTRCLRHSGATVGMAFALLAASLWLFTRLGAEFIPTLDEGDFAMQMTLPAGSSLSKSVDVSLRAEKILKERFPEIKHVVAKIGTAEVPTDPMAVEDADVMIVMKPFDEWTSARSRAEMVEKMKAALAPLADEAEFNFSQPIQLRFNELMTGAKADIAIKLYGEDMEELYAKAKEAARYVAQVPGAADVIVEQAMGLPQLVVDYDRTKIARYGIDIQALNDIVRTAYAGETAGVVFENERRFDLVVRLDGEKVKDLDLNRLYVRTSDGLQVPVSEVATIHLVNGPLQINRDATKRRIVIGVNVRDADIQQVVAQISETLDRHIRLQPGYYFEYGGQFENLQNAIRTLMVVIPIALLLILLLLFFAFRSVIYSLVVFSTVPLSLIGGVVALWLRGLPFSISAGVGFIALFGVAVLNGILMINHFNDLRHSTPYRMCTHRIIFQGCRHLLRPVFLTGLVASLGFVPMAVAQSAGAEVQRPLATVVIGGLMVSTVLTLIVIPAFYRVVNASDVWLRKWRRRKSAANVLPLTLFLLALSFATVGTAQPVVRRVSLDEAVAEAVANSPRLKRADSDVARQRAARGEVWDGGSLQVGYSWGQLNGEPRHDCEWSVEQSLGSLLTPFYQHALVRTRVTGSRFQRELVRKEVVAEVKRAWMECLAATEVCRLAQAQDSLAIRLKETAALRYQQGDINQLEYRMMATLATDLHTQALQATEEVTLARRRLAWAAYADGSLAPADSALALAETPASGLLSPIHLGLFAAQAQEKRDLLKVEKSRFFPELSVGYAVQKIAPLKGLDSWTVGVSFPLLFFPQHSRVRQARHEARMAEWEAEDNRLQLRNRVDDLRGRLAKQRKTVDYYLTAALPEADDLQRNALILYEASETGMAELLQSLATARDIRKSYVEAVRDYNILIIELELFTE